MTKLYDWLPATPSETLVRDALLCVGFGDMAHLCAGATTAMDLPLVGIPPLRSMERSENRQLRARRKYQLTTNSVEIGS